MKERIAATCFVVAYPILAALGLAVHPEPLPIDYFLAAPLLWPLAVFFRRFTVGPTGLEVETAEVKEDLTTAVDAVEEKAQVLPALEAPSEKLQPGELKTGHVSIGATAYIIAADDVPPRDDVAHMLAVSDDAAVQLAALRIAIERELQGAAELAHLQATTGMPSFPLRRLITELLRRELLPSDLAVPLTSVIEVANRAIHGAPIEQGADGVVADLGPRLINGLRRLPSNASWLAALVRVRAGEQRTWEVPGQELAYDVSIGLGIGEVQVHLSASLPLGAEQRGDVVRFVGTTPQGPDLTQSLIRNAPLAWVQDRRILGTRAAKAMAPWLIDNVVEVPSPPVPPETSGFRE